MMRKRIKNRIGSRKGTSLAETLVVVLILSLITTIVAEGIPVAKNVYGKVLDSANAEELLSTAMTELRYQLGTAREIVMTDGTLDADGVTVSGKTMEYRSRNGYRTLLYLDSDGCAQLHEYYDYDSGSGKHLHPLVSNEASSGFTVSYENISYIKGKVTFTGIKVLGSGGRVLARLDQFIIRVTADL